MRVTLGKIELIEKDLIGAVELYCTECSPHQVGCSSPPSPIDDPDEYSSGWKIASGIND